MYSPPITKEKDKILEICQHCIEAIHSNRLIYIAFFLSVCGNQKPMHRQRYTGNWGRFVKPRESLEREGWGLGKGGKSFFFKFSLLPIFSTSHQRYLLRRTQAAAWRQCGQARSEYGS